MPKRLLDLILVINIGLFPVVLASPFAVSSKILGKNMRSNDFATSKHGTDSICDRESNRV